MQSIDSFERYRSAIDPMIVDALSRLGEEGIQAYGSVILQHNTLHTFAPRILEEGLGISVQGTVPDEEDIQFSRDLFTEKGFCHPNSVNLFKKLIEGVHGQRKPGVFLGANMPGDHSPNRGYGIPERMQRLAFEMGVVAMYNSSGPYTAEERKHAEMLFHKYRGRILDNNTSEAPVTVFEIDPFHPVIINNRINPHALMICVGDNPEAAKLGLAALGTSISDGLYIPDPIPPEALKFQSLITIESMLPVDIKNVNPANSMFFNVEGRSRDPSWRRPEW